MAYIFAMNVGQATDHLEAVELKVNGLGIQIVHEGSSSKNKKRFDGKSQQTLT